MTRVRYPLAVTCLRPRGCGHVVVVACLWSRGCGHVLVLTVTCLRSLACGHALAQLRTIAGSLKEAEYPVGKHVIHEGEEGSTFYIIR